MFNLGTSQRWYDKHWLAKFAAANLCGKSLMIITFSKVSAGEKGLPTRGPRYVGETLSALLEGLIRKSDQMTVIK